MSNGDVSDIKTVTMRDSGKGDVKDVKSEIDGGLTGSIGERVKLSTQVKTENTDMWRVNRQI